MAQKIQLKRGLNAGLQAATLAAGEAAFVLDTGKLYVGNGTDKVLINPDRETNIETAEALKTGRKIELAGAVTGEVIFDGSKDVVISATKKDSGVVAGTYTKVTVDAKGDVTLGELLVADDIPTITLDKISDAGTVASKNFGTANGNIPILGPDGKLDTSILPGLALTSTSVVASEAEMLALQVETGDLAIRTDLSRTYVLRENDPTAIGNWSELLSPTDSVLSVNGKQGAVVITAADVSLENVTNESKQTMFASPTFTGTVTAPTAVADDNSTTVATTAFVASAISVLDGGTF